MPHPTQEELKRAEDHRMKVWKIQREFFLERNHETLCLAWRCVTCKDSWTYQSPTLIFKEARREYRELEAHLNSEAHQTCKTLKDLANE